MLPVMYLIKFCVINPNEIMFGYAMGDRGNVLINSDGNICIDDFDEAVEYCREFRKIIREKTYNAKEIICWPEKYIE